MKKEIIVALVLILFTGLTVSFAQKYGSFTDSRDGRVYKTIKIGSEIWMAENLAYASSPRQKKCENRAEFISKTFKNSKGPFLKYQISCNSDVRYILEIQYDIGSNSTGSYLLLNFFGHRSNGQKANITVMRYKYDGSIHYDCGTPLQYWLKDRHDDVYAVCARLCEESYNNSYNAMPDCVAYNYNETNVKKFGYLYSWKEANFVCPEGWHLPSDSEWSQLINHLGGEDVAGGKLKSTSTWNSPNTEATNSSGFSAFPGGYRFSNGIFLDIGDYGYWWSATEYSSTSAWYRGMSYNNGSVNRNDYAKTNGFSVRCLRD